MNVYMAPLQGFTDAIYRRVYEAHFGHIDAFYAPYITLQNDASIRNSQWRDILPEYNTRLPVPQILPANADEAFILTQKIVQLGCYSEVNINLGCPYPMVTNKGRGSGLLPHPDQLSSLLDNLFTHFQSDISFSVKMRCGLSEYTEMYEVIEVLNKYPLDHVILHPRIAKQLYKGKADHTQFAEAFARISHPLVYNGDVFTLDDFNALVLEFPTLMGLMLGRGILQNPLLPLEIAMGDESDIHEKLVRLTDFTNDLIGVYQERLSGDSHLLSKLKSFLPYWKYYNISNTKAYKKAKKAKCVSAFKDGLFDLFQAD